VGDYLKKIELKDARRYLGPGHHDMISLKLHGKSESGCSDFWTALSYVLPGGGHPSRAGDSDQVYFVLEGEVTFITPQGKILLKPYDSLHVGPGEEREMRNESNKVAVMLVTKGGSDSMLKYQD
jgi:mannose-6-phosphate isomerase-like protein (cupin superfamily)